MWRLLARREGVNRISRSNFPPIITIKWVMLMLKLKEERGGNNSNVIHGTLPFKSRFNLWWYFYKVISKIKQEKQIILEWDKPELPQNQCFTCKLLTSIISKINKSDFLDLNSTIFFDNDKKLPLARSASLIRPESFYLFSWTKEFRPICF